MLKEINILKIAIQFIESSDLIEIEITKYKYKEKIQTCSMTKIELQTNIAHLIEQTE
jgi:hypothetical protein